MDGHPSSNLPSGDQWTDIDFPPGDWGPEDDNHERNPFENFPPHLRPGGGVNSYPGSPGSCHDECYVFTDMVADAIECAIHQILNCPNTETIVFVGSRWANRQQKVEQVNFGKWVVPVLKRLKQMVSGTDELAVGVKNTDKPYIDWKH